MYRTFKWYYKERNIMMLLIILPPVGIFLMYKHTDWKKSGKHLITSAHAILTVLVLSVFISWIINTDYFDEIGDTPATVYDCSTSSNQSCLVSEIREDISSLPSNISYDVLLHRSITTDYPEKTIEFEINMSPDSTSRNIYDASAVALVNDVSFSELNRLDYKHIKITFVGTFYKNGIPMNETLIVYNISVNNMMSSNSNSIDQSAISSHEEYINPYFLEE